MTALPDLVSYCDTYLRIFEIEDYPNALNGLQIENSGNVTKVVAAVDFSTRALQATAKNGANLLIVHHGMFWSGLRPLTDTLYRQLKVALESNIAVYSAHLPLDVHAEIGNNILLTRALGIQGSEPFFRDRNFLLGQRASVDLERGELLARLTNALDNPITTVAFGPERVRNVGVITGGAGSEIARVAAEGIDTFITGEAPHWAAIAAEELGINLMIGGHYATETFGVKALAAHLAERFGLDWSFIDLPTGL